MTHNQSNSTALAWSGDEQNREAVFGGIVFSVSVDIGDDGQPDGDYTLALHGSDGSRFATLKQPGDWTAALLEAEDWIADGVIQSAELITDDEAVAK